MRRPLEGIRILECGIFHAGPGGSAILGDLGAEVIKVEQPGEGDPIRTLMRIGSIPFEIPGKRSLFCEGANRNKKSVTIDLKSVKGQELLYRLVKRSDVFLTNMRQPAVEKMNIGYPVLREIKPDLVYASVSAFGSRGPDRDRGGFDYQGQARSGMMYAMGDEGSPPTASQFGLADQVTAIMASHQILTALLMRERTGVGQEVHVSILGSSMFLNLINNPFLKTLVFLQVIHPCQKYEVEVRPLRIKMRCMGHADGTWPAFDICSYAPVQMVKIIPCHG